MFVRTKVCIYICICIYLCEFIHLPRIVKLWFPLCCCLLFTAITRGYCCYCRYVFVVPLTAYNTGPMLFRALTYRCIHTYICLAACICRPAFKGVESKSHARNSTLLPCRFELLYAVPADCLSDWRTACLRLSKLL